MEQVAQFIGLRDLEIEWLKIQLQQRNAELEKLKAQGEEPASNVRHL